MEFWNDVWADFVERIRFPLRMMGLGMFCMAVAMIQMFVVFGISTVAIDLPHKGMQWLLDVVAVVDVILLAFGALVLVLGYASYCFPEIKTWIKPKEKT